MAQKTIGRYEIRSELGRGGMGAVYLAYDPALEREVALKLLPSYFAQDPEFSQRFAREARTVAGLDHQAIVAVYDFGEDDVWPYFVMRYMRGGSLKDRLAKGPLDLAQASHIVQRIAGALDKAHSKGVVHRDLKPANILYDGEGQPYLGDFGIVRLAESSENFTRTGNALGTPAYMSPEQADALPDVDGRSDVYSLGVVLYEMLAGEPPYQHDSMPRLLIMHLTAPIPDLIAARPDLPAALQDVIDKAMAKDRDDRYQSAGELAASLQAVAQAAARPARQPRAAAPKPTSEPQPAAAQQPSSPPAAAKPAFEEKTADVRQSAPVPQPPARQTPAPKAAAPQSPAPASQPAVAQQAATQQPPPQMTVAQPAPRQPAAAPAKSGGRRKWILGGAVFLAAICLFAVAVIVLGSGLFSNSGSSGKVQVVQEEVALAEVPVEEAIVEPVGSGDQSPTLQRIIERGQIRFGVGEGNSPPLLTSPGPQASGFEADLFAAVTERLTNEPFEVDYVIVSSGQRLETITDGSADVSYWVNETSVLDEAGALAAGTFLLDGQRAMVHEG
ncbi:MAG: serine/threonine-protein kinase, partial [Candidatus Promineifilaceae bacterium]